MLVSMVLAVFLPCVGFSALSLVYTCLLCYIYGRHRERYSQDDDGGPRAPGPAPVGAKPGGENGLSETELEQVPRVTGKDLVRGNDCAVCLDDIGSDEEARKVPGCNHGFHVQCADTWLSKHRVCPVCRAKLEPQLLNAFDRVNQMV